MSDSSRLRVEVFDCQKTARRLLENWQQSARYNSSLGLSRQKELPNAIRLLERFMMSVHRRHPTVWRTVSV